MLQDFASIMESTSKADFESRLVKAAADLGFPLVSAMSVFDRADGEADFYFVSNSPDEWLDGPYNEPSECKRDPVMQHVKRSSIPIVWDQGVYLRSGAIELWEAQAVFGLATGICTAMHMPNGTHFSLGVDRDVELPRSERELADLAGKVQLLTTYACDVGMQYLPMIDGRSAKPSSLTKHEAEILRWVLDGKSSWEVGEKLNLSERLVANHAQAAARKLGAVNNTQAAIIAWRRGLIR